MLFAVIIKDDDNIPTQIYPLNALNFEAIYEDRVLFLKFLLRNGKVVTYPYSNIIHLRKILTKMIYLEHLQLKYLKRLWKL